VEWLAFSSNVFNAFVPFYANIEETPAYLASTGEHASTDSFTGPAVSSAPGRRPLREMPQPHRALPVRGAVEGARAHREIRPRAAKPDGGPESVRLCQQANRKIADMLRQETENALDTVLYEASCRMKNSYARSDT
jgi:dipeptidase